MAEQKLTEQILDEMSQEDFDDLVENYEQLDELSKKTLGFYIRQASRNAGHHKSNAERAETAASVMGVHTNTAADSSAMRKHREGLYGLQNKHEKKVQKRDDGIFNALRRLTKESLDEMSQEDFDDLVENYEQLDELSKSTLGSYIKKATRDYGDQKTDKSVDLLYKKIDFMSPEHKKYNRNITNRRTGVDKAVGKLMKESVADLVYAIASGKAAESHAAFEVVMNEKIDARLEEYRDQVASSLFTEPEEVNEEVESLDELSKEDFDDLVENYEQLDELSKNTIASYLEKNLPKSLAAAGSLAQGKDVKKNISKISKGYTNQRKALKRLTKESLDEMSQEDFDDLVENYEQLDELSKNTIQHYIAKNSESRVKIAKGKTENDKFRDHAMSLEYNGNLDRSGRDGIQKVRDSLNKQKSDLENKDSKRHHGLYRALTRVAK